MCPLSKSAHTLRFQGNTEHFNIENFQFKPFSFKVDQGTPPDTDIHATHVLPQVFYHRAVCKLAHSTFCPMATVFIYSCLIPMNPPFDGG